jgi:6-pyruvoyltetrahydropterin/6-carboxytetrahydropterin synthase
VSYTVAAQVRFSAGHRILGYSGKCLSPHGHSYRAQLCLEGESLDRLGLLVDFGEVKDSVRAWIGENWDHAFLVNSHDKAMIDALASVSESRTYLFEDANPTAENMARVLCLGMRGQLGPIVRSAIIWETSEQHAMYTV